jgi:tetratricopeptide (TPR) repeat protein
LALHELDSEPVHDIDLVSRILAETAQADLSNSTLYSDAVDLTTGTVTIFDDRRYDHPVTLNLSDELRKGRRMVDQATLFPQKLTDVIETDGLGRAISLVKAGQFGSGEVSRAGYRLLLDGRFEDGVKLFRAARNKFRTASANSDLGNALNSAGRTSEAMTSYRAALALDPSDHSANLMAGTGGRVVFRLKGFTYANRVSVVGSFNQTNPSGLVLSHQGDEWIGEIRLPKGKYTYAFHVDDSWTTDPYNGLACRPSEWYSSVLFVTG